MRRACLLALVASLAGCTGGFPADSVVVAEVEVRDLEPGRPSVHDFALATPAGFLATGFRVGSEVVHIMLRAPGGPTYDTLAEDPRGPCAVRAPAPGTWALIVQPDALSPPLAAGKFTVRAAPGAPPGLFACVDDAFPGRGRAVTLGAWHLNLTENATESFAFEQPYELRNLTVFLRPAANATFLLTPPGQEARPPDQVGLPSQGRWSVQVAAHASFTNATLAVQGIGG